MSFDSSAVRLVDDLRGFIKKHHTGVTDAEFDDCKKYENSYPDMVKQEIVLCVEAVFFLIEEKARDQRSSVEETCTAIEAKHFVNQIHEMVKKDVFKNKSVYSITNNSLNGAIEKTGRDTTNIEIKMTELMQRLYNKHKDAHPVSGKVLHSHNSHLNFDDATPARRSDPPKVLIGNFQAKNFLNVKPKEFQEAFRGRLERMQEMLVHELHRLMGVTYTPPTKENSTTFDEPRFLIGRLTYEVGDKDNEPKFTADRIIMECIVSREVGKSVSIAKFPLNFTTLKQDYFLYPNMVVAVEVTGDIFIFEEDAFKVHRMIEISNDRDVDPESVLQLPTKFVQSRLTVLFFKGPFTIEGNQYFGELAKIILA